MKAKYALIALLAITFFGCDDNTAGLGLGMFPKSDQNINGKLTTFDVTTKSIPVGEVYAKTNIGYVGKFTDETFGTYQAGFLAQLNCPEVWAKKQAVGKSDHLLISIYIFTNPFSYSFCKLIRIPVFAWNHVSPPWK